MPGVSANLTLPPWPEKLVQRRGIDQTEDCAGLFPLQTSIRGPTFEQETDARRSLQRALNSLKASLHLDSLAGARDVLENPKGLLKKDWDTAHWLQAYLEGELPDSVDRMRRGARSSWSTPTSSEDSLPSLTPELFPFANQPPCQVNTQAQRLEIPSVIPARDSDGACTLHVWKAQQSQLERMLVLQMQQQVQQWKQQPSSP
eukprot:TRINITY_DN94780_c0_g1_i1.p1 TRINITY_DN94780_c0_g1~~TRINITY_DN94780_c0_g1_i1.p1  ORF type:complete len:202 (-),score=39.79 TRINITY_DN94780_c0_g1_i1:23-628(-)